MKTITLTLVSLFIAVFAIAQEGKMEVSADATIYQGNPENSSVNWLGKKVTGSHEGTIGLDAANFIMQDGKLIGGYVVIDMTSIECSDLTGEKKGGLEGHLKSEDFFHVEEYPEASLTVTSVKKYITEDANYKVQANLTIKGQTHPVEFPVMITLNDNDGLSAKGTLQFDRTLYDVQYGSGSLFSGLGDKIIYDNVTLSFDVNSTK